MSTKKTLLYEVSIIRPLVIFLMVVYHAFCIYGGQWQAVNNTSIPAYKIFTWIISGFRIETIALVAGYVFAFQVIDLGRKYSLKTFAWKKFKRLILPCLFFGVFYYFLFYFDVETFSVLPFLDKLLSGPGHLWFLPMLFWCFISLLFICNYNLSSKWLFALLYFASIVPIPYLPLGLQQVPHFLFYFYGGYLLYKYKSQIAAKAKKWFYIIPLIIVYFAFIWLKTAYNQNLVSTVTEGGGMLQKLIILTSNGMIGSFVKISGILALYLIVLCFTDKPTYQPKQWILYSSTLCYGVYIYHQFILRILYYGTQLPEMCNLPWKITLLPEVLNPWLLPWVSLSITLVLSVFLAWLTLKTKFGRFLIG